MDIFNMMDCVGCGDYKHHAAHITADAYYSYPEEDGCERGGFDGYPCDRMLGAIEDMIDDGELETADGYFGTGDCLAALQDKGEAPDGFKFADAPYWWVSMDGAEAKPYRDTEEIYNEWFG